MAIIFDPNVAKLLGLRAGFGFWRIKELLVTSGMWSVIGTGDGSSRFAYLGVTAALSVPNQGSGGAYDCLKTGNGVGTLVAGDWSTAGWCVVQDASGRQVLMVDSSGTPDSSWNSYGRVAYSRLSGFVGASANATTIPAAAADEQWIWGSRAAPNGVEVFDYNAAGYIHFYAHNTLTNSVAGFGWLAAATGGTVGTFCAFSAMQDYDSNAIADPSCWVKSPNTVSAWTVYGSPYASWDASVTVLNPAGNTFPVEPQGGGKDPLTRIFGLASASTGDASITTSDIGYPIDVVADRLTTTRLHPDLLNDGTNVWLVQSSAYGMPWPSTAITPLSGTSVTRSCSLYSPPLSSKGEGVVPVSQELIPVAYYQRVWDVVNALWCYYTKSVVDANPAPTETSPVHSGTITGHSVLSTKVG